jgi:hypothetical protein
MTGKSIDGEERLGLSLPERACSAQNTDFSKRNFTTSGGPYNIQMSVLRIQYWRYDETFAECGVHAWA